MNKKQSINLTLPKEIYDYLNTQSEELGISLATLIRLIVVYHFNEGIVVEVKYSDVKGSQRR